MCGITGLFAFNMVGRINLIHLEGATRCLEKRGPDHQGSWFDDVVGLGQRRLSIIDTSDSANQPMVDDTGRYRIIFNGEIYNYRQLKRDLSAKGISFQPVRLHSVAECPVHPPAAGGAWRLLSL